jgi:hypothetical protein
MRVFRNDQLNVCDRQSTSHLDSKKEAVAGELADSQESCSRTSLISLYVWRAYAYRHVEVL